MSKNRRLRVYFVLTAIVALSILVLERRGIFLYMSYIAPIFVLLITYLAGWLLLAGTVPSSNGVKVLHLLTLPLLVLVVLLPHIVLDSRKAFFLEYQGITPGMSIEEIEQRLQKHEVITRETAQGISYYRLNDGVPEDGIVVAPTDDQLHAEQVILYLD